MLWKKTELQLKLLKVAEECALRACKIDIEWYNKYRLSRRSEITTVKKITAHIAARRAWVNPQVIGDFFKGSRASAFYHIQSCQDLLDTDKIFAAIYKKARNEFNEILAQMGDIY